MDPVTDKYEINYSIKLPFYIKMSAFHFPNSNPLLIQLVPESLVFDKSSHLLGILAQKKMENYIKYCYNTSERQWKSKHKDNQGLNSNKHFMLFCIKILISYIS